MCTYCTGYSPLALNGYQVEVDICFVALILHFFSLIRPSLVSHYTVPHMHITLDESIKCPKNKCKRKGHDSCIFALAPNSTVYNNISFKKEKESKATT